MTTASAATLRGQGWLPGNDAKQAVSGAQRERERERKMRVRLVWGRVRVVLERGRNRKRRSDGVTERWRDGEMERWRDGEMERWRDGEMERWRERRRLPEEVAGKRPEMPTRLRQLARCLPAELQATGR